MHVQYRMADASAQTAHRALCEVSLFTEKFSASRLHYESLKIWADVIEINKKIWALRARNSDLGQVGVG